MAEAADKTESGENAKRMACDPDDHINVKEYLQTKNEEWDRRCGKFPPNDDVFMRGYLERQFCRWSHFRGYDFDSIKMRPFPEFDRNGKIDLEHAKSKSSFRYVIGFSRPCDTYDIQFLLHCINVAVQKGKRKFPAAIHTRVHINGATHGDKTGGYVYVRAPGKGFDFYKKGAYAFSKKDQQLLDNCGLKGSPHNCTLYEPALYPLARFIINAWCYSADGFYGGLYIPWGRVAMLFGSNDFADMDDKFKKLKPINNDGKRMQTTGKCANKKCIGDDLSLRKCKCEACIKVDPNGRLWCKKTCICNNCGQCHPDNNNPCTHCNKIRDGEAGEGTIGKQSFDKLFASFERKQSTITSNDLEKYLEKFQLNEDQTHASNVQIYQPSICSDTQKPEEEEVEAAGPEKEAKKAEPEEKQKGLDSKKEEEKSAEKIPMGGFDPANKSAGLVISEHGRVVSGPGRNTAICRQELTEGKHKFAIMAGKNSWIGFAHSRFHVFSKEEKLGWRGHVKDGYSYCYDGDIGHNGKDHSGKRAPRIAKGDIVAAEIDFGALTITYWHNGVRVWYTQNIKPGKYKAAVTMGSPSTIKLLDRDEDLYQVFVYHHEDWFKNTIGGHYKVKKGGKLLGTRNWDERNPFMDWLKEMRQTELPSDFGVSKQCPGPWELAITQEEYESYWLFKFEPFDD